MSESLSHQRFRSRIEYLEQHGQVIDLAIVQALKVTRLARNKSVKIPHTFGEDATKYHRLNHPTKAAPRLFNYSKSLNCEHSMISLYRHFGDYLRGILGEMYEQDPLAIVGKVQGSALTFHDLVKLGSFEAIQKKMIDATFRKLESEKSTTKLMERVLEHTKISTTTACKGNALMYLEMRHLFIHNSGRCDSAFERNYDRVLNVKSGQELPTDFRTTDAAIKSVVALVGEIDRLLIMGNFVPARPKGTGIAQ